MNEWWERHKDWSRQWELRLGDSKDELLAHRLARLLEAACHQHHDEGVDRPQLVVIKATRKTLDLCGFKARQPIKAIQNALSILFHSRTQSGPGSSGIVHFYSLTSVPRKGLRPLPGWIVEVGYELRPSQLWPVYGHPSQTEWEAMR